MIRVQGLHVRYPEAWALRGVDLSLAPGAFTLVGGPSGGGKSTLALALMGLIPQSVPAEVEGDLLVAGQDPRRCPVERLAGRVGLVFQSPATQLFNGTVAEEVAFGPRNRALSEDEVAARAAFAVEATGCVHLQGRSVRRLSSGEQQRVVLAAVLAMRPALLILDEPTANLDDEGVRRLVHTLVDLHGRSGITLLIVEHRLDPFLPHADRLVWLDEGRVVADGPPAETLARLRCGARPDPAPPFSCADPLVALHEVTAGYEGQPVVRRSSLTLRRGEFAALVGANGSGKTTVARVLAGLLRPARGRVIWYAGDRRPRVGFLQQNPLHQLVCDTVEEEVSFGARNLGLGENGRVDRILAQMDLQGVRHRRTRALSVGQQQRAALAATVAMRPALLILDEPTVGQDWEHLVRTMDFVRRLNQEGQTVLLITHDLRLVERYASRVLRIEGQRVLEWEQRNV